VTEQEFAIGMVGLGVMGRNLVLNMADHGFSVSGYDKDAAKCEQLRDEAGDRAVHAADTLQDFIQSLSSPRAIMLLVPAGPIVDSVIQELVPNLADGDLIIDAGNSHFKDTNRRAESLSDHGIHYLGMGVSGGESGARFGPSLMPGGPREAYTRVQSILESVAAHVGDSACVSYLGPGSAGHYVKMVHNGIEYGLMQLIAESYDLMKRGLGLKNEELADVYAEWNAGELNGFLMEITSHIFRKKDDLTGKYLIDLILDEARQKGTGMWTTQDAMDIQIPTPVIDAAVAARNLSAMKSERQTGSRNIDIELPAVKVDRQDFIGQLKNALYLSMITAYAQGMAQLRGASKTYAYDLNLEEVARIWRGGCIIRAALLEDIRTAFHSQSDLANLLIDKHFSQIAQKNSSDLRSIVSLAAQFGLPVPAMMASLAYLDGYRSSWLPANLIQAQRDDFGAHTYQRVDKDGIFHTQWG
jgi:6-phosphogluconate dehydrogenase